MLNKAKKSNMSLNMIKNQADNIKSKINNIDANLPGNVLENLNKSKKNLEYTAIKNKTLLEKRQNQDFVKNLFDSQSRAAQKEVAKAQKKFLDAQNKKQKAMQSTLTNLNVDLDRTMSSKKMIEDASGITNMKNNVSEMQKAYDKAVRATRNTRMATVGGIGATAYGANKLKQNNNQEAPKYNYYSSGLNNEYQ